MLFESQVISSVSKYLKGKGHKIIQELNESQKGDDIISIDSKGSKYYIEAKGETSSKKGSSRYGKPFTSSQVGVHVAKAFYRAAQIKQENSHNCKVGIALPKTKEHQKKIQKIEKTLKDLSIEVLWVNKNKSVDLMGNWKRSI